MMQVTIRTLTVEKRDIAMFSMRYDLANPAIQTPPTSGTAIAIWLLIPDFQLKR
ncbi:hypothetical protein [Rhizobium sp. J15]|uniref:hypothetical protein n=1 Tax=Rhizobium sp. J15 TaxID=2035450 RepID=UPI0015963EE0|nr:hypothetical protein [Rhizobium sp. J15]